MNALGVIFCLLNLTVAVVSFMPCMMVAAMSMDSPQAQHDPLAITFMWLFFTFPVVCGVSGLLSLLSLWRGWFALIGFIPYVEAVAVFGYIWFFAR